MQAVEEKVQSGTDRNADEVFDLVIGDLEQEIPPLASPANSGPRPPGGNSAGG
ncbi:hypothetical protein ACFV0W_21025 [Streptomyces anulatus]